MADLASYVEQAAEEFVKEDNPIVDNYFDKFLGDLKLSEKHAYALIGLCEICFAQGMIKAMGDMAG